MKKILFILLLLPFVASSQVKQVYNQYGGTWNRLALKDSGAFQLPKKTMGIKDLNAGLDTAQLRYDPSDSSVKVYTGNQWLAVSGGSGSAKNYVHGLVDLNDSVRVSNNRRIEYIRQQAEGSSLDAGWSGVGSVLYSVSGGQWIFGGNNNTGYTQYIRSDAGVLSEGSYIECYVIVDSLRTTSPGPQIGWKSYNTYSGGIYQWDVYGGIVTGSAATNSGKAFIYGSSSASITVSDSARTTYPGDTLYMRLDRTGIDYLVRIENKRQGWKLQRYTSTTPAGPFIAHNSAYPVFIPGGGGYRVYGFKYVIDAPLLVENYIIGNSITYGSGATTQYNRWPALVGNPSSNIISGGGADGTQSILDRMQEIYAINPKRVVLMIGGNDVRLGLSGWDTRYRAIRDSLTAHSIEVVHCFPTPRNTTDESPLKDFIDTSSAFLGDRKIDTWTSLLGSGTSLNSRYAADNQHPNDAGHAQIAYMVNTALHYDNTDIYPSRDVIIKNGSIYNAYKGSIAAFTSDSTGSGITLANLNPGGSGIQNRSPGMRFQSKGSTTGGASTHLTWDINAMTTTGSSHTGFLNVDFISQGVKTTPFFIGSSGNASVQARTTISGYTFFNNAGTQEGYVLMQHNNQRMLFNNLISGGYMSFGNGSSGSEIYFAAAGITTEPNVGALFGQNTTRDASALVQLNSTTKGLLPSRMTAAQRIAISSPAAGLIVFDTDSTSLFQYSGSVWQNLYNAVGGGSGGWDNLGTGYGLVNVNDSTYRIDTSLMTTRAWHNRGMESLGGLITAAGAVPTLQQVLDAGSTLTTAETITGTVNSGTLLSITNSSTSSGRALSVTSNAAGISTLFATTSTSNTNGVEIPYQAFRTTTGTAANGISSSWQTNIEMANGSGVVASQLVTRLTDAAAATVVSDFSIIGQKVAVVDTFMNVQHSGVVRVNNNADTLATKAYARSVGGGGGIVYPGAGVAVSNGSAWTTSITNTTVGTNFLSLTNPSAITFPRINADNTVTARPASDFRSDIGAGTGNGDVTKVGTPANTEIGVWTGDGTLGRDANLTWVSPRLLIGSSSGSTSTATPSNLDLGDTYSSVAGSNAKLKLFSTSGGSFYYGFGVSASQLDYMAPSPGSHVFYTNGTEKARLNNDGEWIVNTTDGGTFFLQIGGNSRFTGRLDLADISAPSTPASGYGALYVNSDKAYMKTDGGTVYELSNKFNPLTTNVTSVGNVGTGEDDLMTYSVPAGTLAADGDYIDFEMVFSFAANANNKTVKLYFGATQIYTSGAQAQNAGNMIIKGRVYRTSATTQRISVVQGNNTTLFYDETNYTTASETLSGAITLKATGEATSNDDISQVINSVTYIRL